MIECQHLSPDGCKLAGSLCKLSAIPVEETTCKLCLKCTRPRPQTINSVTAGLALRYARKHNIELPVDRRKFLYEFSKCKGQDCNKINIKDGDNLRLICKQSPGDVLVMTAAIESLAATFPNRWKIGYSGTAEEIFENNPHISEFEDGGKVVNLQMEYPAIHRSNSHHIHFLLAYIEFLGTSLGINLPITTNRPHIYLSDEEKSWMSQVSELVGGRHIEYAVVNAGVKADYTTKQWPVEYYQTVINETQHRIQWVQVGSLEHDHFSLRNVIDMRGKTDIRQLIRLVYHSKFGIGPVTFLQHIYAAFEKPYICLLGGREPVTWVTYPFQHTLHTMGQLLCCKNNACWRSRVVGESDSLCEMPVLGGIRPVGRCMSLIQPWEAIGIIKRLI